MKKFMIEGPFPTPDQIAKRFSMSPEAVAEAKKACSEIKRKHFLRKLPARTYEGKKV